MQIQYMCNSLSSLILLPPGIVSSSRFTLPDLFTRSHRSVFLFLDEPRRFHDGFAIDCMWRARAQSCAIGFTNIAVSGLMLYPRSNSSNASATIATLFHSTFSPLYA